MRERRLWLMARRDAERLVAQLTSLRCHGFVDQADLPAWIEAEMRKVRRVTSQPDATLDERAGQAELLSWMSAFLAESGISGRCCVSSGISAFPWLDCEPRDDDWLANLVTVRGSELSFVSHGRDVAVVFFEEEYTYEAFRLTPDRPRRDDGSLP
ncbi:MAG TPA: hypothetical protein VIL00_04035 [Pseudonocardiaceae bacterium]